MKIEMYKMKMKIHVSSTNKKIEMYKMKMKIHVKRSEMCVSSLK